MRLYLTSPSQPKPQTALVVALHGCTQTAAEYQKAGWDRFAETHGFYVLYGESTQGSRCFRWFDATQIARGRGEAASIVQGVEYVLGRHDIDPKKVFVTGAHKADWCCTIARTDPSSTGKRGLSMFLVDMATPGVEVVRVPTANRWTLSTITFDGFKSR